jgi:hypothetical protein
MVITDVVITDMAITDIVITTLVIVRDSLGPPPLLDVGSSPDYA